LVDDGPSFADIVTEHNRYFHPLARTWPKRKPDLLSKASAETRAA